MKEILYIADIGDDAEIDLLREELAHYSYSLSNAVTLAKALDFVRGYQQVLINARDSKLAALELVKNIRDVYKGAIKVFVYLPKSSASEGSKFGHYGAEVEDELSIPRIIDKLPDASKRDYKVDEEIVVVHSMQGGAGASLLAILISNVLGKSGHSSLLMDLSPAATSIRDALALEAKPALLSRDRNKEQDLSKDSDWFSGYISRSCFLPESFYLHLFESAAARDLFSLRAAKYSDAIASQLSAVAARAAYYQHNPDELCASLRAATSSLALLSQELSGAAYSLFDEVLRPGSQLAKYFVIDIGTDISNSVSRQFLKFAKHMVVLLRDSPGAQLKQNSECYFKYLKDTYDLNIIPVLAPGHHRYHDYLKFSAAEWQSLLGFEPLILPYQPEEISAFVLDHEDIVEASTLSKFTSALLGRMGYSEERNRKSLMDFLVRNA